MSIPVSVAAQASTDTVVVSTALSTPLEPLLITAPHMENSQIRTLKAVRTTGSLTAISGAGLLAYAVFFTATGPVGWAAGLMFFGGLTAYLSHRRLQGQDDFSPNQSAAPSSTEATEP